MSGPSAGVVPGVEAETAVPTLKVMRLQKPELHSVSYIHMYIVLLAYTVLLHGCLFKI